jgi:hypothetical protein
VHLLDNIKKKRLRTFETFCTRLWFVLLFSSSTDVYIATIVQPLYNFGYLPVGPHFDCSIYQRVVHPCCKLLLKRGITRLLHVLISVNVRGLTGKLLFWGYVSRNTRTAATSRNVLSPFHLIEVILERINYFIYVLACLELRIGVFFVVAFYVICRRNGTALPNCCHWEARPWHHSTDGRSVVASISLSLGCYIVRN